MTRESRVRQLTKWDVDEIPKEITSTEGIILAERIADLRERTQRKIDLITAVLVMLTVIVFLMYEGVLVK